MRKISKLLVILLLAAPIPSLSEDVLRNTVAPTALLITGIGIGTVWTMDLISQKNINLEGGFFKARDRSTHQILWPHLLAEYGTASALIVSAVGLYEDKPWAKSMTLVSSGLLAYTSINSMSWVLSEKGRMMYAVPMIIGLTSAGVAIVAVF